MSYRSGLAALIIICVAVTFISGSLFAAEPSENEGRSGQYQVKGEKRYHYWVKVPSTYSVTNPAGLYLYFHGQNGQSGANYFGKWEQSLLERHNLIGINMQYMDGDNARDTAGKLMAAQQAVAQVMADYRVLPRGVVSCFSGGALPHKMWYARRGPEWPFTMCALYGSNFNQSIGKPSDLAWFVGIGTGEWNKAGLGRTQTRRFAEAVSNIGKGGNPLVRYLIIPGKGHTVTIEDCRQVGELFAIQDAFTAPLVHMAEAAEDKTARKLVLLTNARQFGRVSKEIAKLRKQGFDSEVLSAFVESLEPRINKAVDNMINQLTTLAESDMYLFQAKVKKAAVQLRGHPREDAVKELTKVAKSQKNARAQLQAMNMWLKIAPQLFKQEPRISDPAQRLALEKIHQA